MTLGRLIDSLLDDPEGGEPAPMILGLVLWCLSVGMAATLILLIAVIVAWLPFSAALGAFGAVCWGFARVRSRRR